MSKGLRDAEQFDRHPSSRARTRIASQPLCPRETRMCPLCPGKGCGRDSRSGSVPRLHLDLHALMAKQLDACPSMNSSTPVTPEKRLIPDDERMQEDTHLARFARFAAIPLALLAERTGAATANAGGIHHAQAPIGFSTSLLESQRTACWTPQRPIRLERKV